MPFLMIFLVFLIMAGNTNAQYYVTPEVVTVLSDEVEETSGLINISGQLWTHNDSGGEAELYNINLDGEVIRSVIVQNASNADWEDLAADEDYVYIGDFGNNYGNRTDLKVYRVSRIALETQDIINADVVHFSYSDQTSWEPNHNNNDFDCEAFISFDNHLYLFSKNWVDKQTKLYRLSNQPGTHVAQYQETFDVDGLISGAEILGPDNLALCGYSESGHAFNWVFRKFEGDDFFGGNNIRLNWTIIAQVEGICHDGGDGIYLSAENLAGMVDPTLYFLDISEFLLEAVSLLQPQFNVIYFNNFLQIKTGFRNKRNIRISIIDPGGRMLYNRNAVCKEYIRIPLYLKKGIYILQIQSGNLKYSGKLWIE